MSINENLLVRKAQHGNLAAFEELVSMYDEKVMNLILNMVNNVEDARDIYQEVFLKVFLTIKAFRFKSKFYTWLFRIAINTSINYRKKRTLKQVLPLWDNENEQGDDGESFVLDQTTNPERKFLNVELSSNIQQSINRLSSKQKTVFVLRHYLGYKLSEIAEIMACAEGTVKNYLFRSVQKLQRELKEFQHN